MSAVGTKPKQVAESYPKDHPNYRCFQPTWFPPIPVPIDYLKELGQTPEGLEKVKWFLQKREETITDIKSAPLELGWEPEMWHDADKLLERVKVLLILGSNRSSKSWYAGKRTQNVLCRVSKLNPMGSDYEIGWLDKLSKVHPDRLAWCFHTQELTSISLQQPILWHFMPQRIQQMMKLNPALFVSRKRKGIATDIGYTIKNGFTGSRFVLPNTSQCFFFNYRQDRDIIEGGQIDLAWCDELVPVDWLVRLQTRIIDRGGKIICTFTPVRGYTETVADFLNGARITQWKECRLPRFKDKVLWPGGKPGMAPYIAECISSEKAVIWFHAFENPFLVSGWEGFCRQYEGKSESQQKEVLLGITQKTSGCKFPKFGKHNIIPADKVPKEGTNYHLMDFAYNRNWAMIWIRAVENHANGKTYYYVYRDWPDADTYGSWVEPDEKPDGARGPAQSLLLSGVTAYKKLILELEGTRSSNAGSKNDDGAGAEVIFRRFGDARSGNTASWVEEGGTSILDRFNDAEGTDFLEVEPVIAADGTSLIIEGVNLINEWLEYDETQPFSPANEPRFYVAENCQQVIDCIRLWTGEDGNKGASKDFIDLLRYTAAMQLDHVDASEPVSRGGGSY